MTEQLTGVVEVEGAHQEASGLSIVDLLDRQSAFIAQLQATGVMPEVATFELPDFVLAPQGEAEPEAEQVAAEPEATTPVAAPEPTVAQPARPSLFKRVTRSLAISVTEMGSEIRSVRQSVEQSVSEGIKATRARIAEATMTRKAKIARSFEAAAPVLENSIAIVPTPFDPDAQDKHANIQAWITPVTTDVDGKPQTTYRFTDEGRTLTEAVAQASGAQTVRTRAEFDVVCAALSEVYATQKAKIEAERVASSVLTVSSSETPRISFAPSPAADARAASQLELARRVTSRARLQALISLKAEERAQKNASAEVIANRANAQSMLSEIYLGLEAGTDDREAEWSAISNAIHDRYRHMVVQIEIEAVFDDLDFEARTQIKNTLLAQARKQCATARLMAWNEMFRQKPTVPAEAVALVEAVEAVEESLEPMVVMDPEEAPAQVFEAEKADAETQEPTITPVVETRGGKLARLHKRWSGLSTGEKALVALGTGAVIGATGLVAQIASNSARISAQQAEEAAMAERYTGSVGSVSLAELPSHVQARVSGQDAAATPTAKPAKSRPFGSFRDRRQGRNGEVAPAVQTLQAGAMVRHQAVAATETAEPEKSPRVDYSKGPVKVTVTCGDRVIPFTMKADDGSIQDVIYEIFAKKQDLPDEYDMPTNRAARINNDGVLVSAYHSEVDGVEANAGDFQNYVVRNGGPAILAGCRVEAEDDQAIEGFTITHALEVPTHIDGRETSIDDILGKIQESREEYKAKNKVELPPIDEVGYTCFRFVDRKTSQFLVWVLTRTDATRKNSDESVKAGDGGKPESMLPVDSGFELAKANMSRNANKMPGLEDWQRRQLRKQQLAQRGVRA